MIIAVLIVEDEFLLRVDAVDFMGAYGFTMYEAGNADEAIALLELHDDIRAVFTEHAWIHGWPKAGPLRSGTLAADQANHHLWPGKTAGRRHAGWKRVRRQALSARKGRRRFARDDRLTGFAGRRGPDELPHAKQPYHGDLRRALIDTALELVTEEQEWAFSLLEVARRAGAGVW